MLYPDDLITAENGR